MSSRAKRPTHGRYTPPSRGIRVRNSAIALGAAVLSSGFTLGVEAGASPAKPPVMSTQTYWACIDTGDNEIVGVEAMPFTQQFCATQGETTVLTQITGPQGLQGLQGVQGNQGSQGIQGLQGNQGAQGNQGNNGSQGFQGFQGPQGTQGNNGSQGFQGPQGSQGKPGAQGNQGNNGSQGFQGYQGVQGNQGSNGAQGPQGVQGNQGSSTSLIFESSQNTNPAEVTTDSGGTEGTSTALPLDGDDPVTGVNAGGRVHRWFGAGTPRPDPSPRHHNHRPDVPGDDHSAHHLSWLDDDDHRAARDATEGSSTYFPVPGTACTAAPVLTSIDGTGNQFKLLDRSDLRSAQHRRDVCGRGNYSQGVSIKYCRIADLQRIGGGDRPVGPG